MLRNTLFVIMVAVTCFANQQTSDSNTTKQQEKADKNPESMNGFEKAVKSVGGIGKDAKDVYKNIVQGDDRK